MRNVMVRRATAVAVSCAFAAMCGQALAADLFIGTLRVKDGALVLERCALGRDLYALRDAEGEGAVASLLRQPVPAQGFWYGEVIGDYVEVAGGHGLLVSSIESIEPGKTCHLTDMLGTMDGEAEPAQTTEASKAAPPSDRIQKDD